MTPLLSAALLLQAGPITRIACDGFCAPRWQHHLLYAGVSLGVFALLHYGFDVGPKKSAWLATLGVGLAPHLVALTNRQSDVYPINRADWVADLQIRSAPMIIGYAIVRDTVRGSPKNEFRHVSPRRVLLNSTLYGVSYITIGARHASP